AGIDVSFFKACKAVHTLLGAVKGKGRCGKDRYQVSMCGYRLLCPVDGHRTHAGYIFRCHMHFLKVRKEPVVLYFNPSLAMPGGKEPGQFVSTVILPPFLNRSCGTK